MKINEVIVESQVDEGAMDSLKNLGKNFTSGLKGGAKMGTRDDQGKFTKAGMFATAANKLGKGVAGAPGALGKLGKGIKAGVAGYKQNQAVRQATGKLNDLASTAMSNWNNVEASIRAGGQQSTPQQAQQWLAKYTGSTPTSAPANTRPDTMNDWITKELGNFHSQVNTGAQPTNAKVKAAPQQATNDPGLQGEAQSPQDVVARLQKLHPDWIPEIAQLILKQSPVSANK